MLVAIVIGMFPLMFKEYNRVFWYMDLVSSLLFIIDYILRWSTAQHPVVDCGNSHHRPAFRYHHGRLYGRTEDAQGGEEAQRKSKLSPCRVRHKDRSRNGDARLLVQKISGD
jgi:hypothetical protein